MFGHTLIIIHVVQWLLEFICFIFLRLLITRLIFVVFFFVLFGLALFASTFSTDLQLDSLALWSLPWIPLGCLLTLVSLFGWFT